MASTSLSETEIQIALEVLSGKREIIEACEHYCIRPIDLNRWINRFITDAKKNYSRQQKEAYDAKEYEKIVCEIARSIFEIVEGVRSDQVKCGNKCHVPGASSYSHQIDVLVRGAQDQILIECKHWTKNVPVEAVLTFVARILDIKPTFSGKTHAVMATTVKYDPGAKKIARYYDIDLRIVRSAEEFAMGYKKLQLIRPPTAVMRFEAISPTVTQSKPVQDQSKDLTDVP